MGKKESKKTNNLLIGILIVIGIALITIIITNSTSGTGKVTYNPQNENPEQQNSNQQTCKDVQIPYDYLEEYSETVPYTDKECEQQRLVYKRDEGTCLQRKDNFFSADEPAKYDCTMTNLDTEGGVFSIRIGFNVNGQQLEETQSRYIYPQSSEKFTIERDATITSCYCIEENTPTKQVCRDVTKYRDVIKTRTVTRYRMEQQCE
jgi:hypothetical protein